MMVLKGIEGKGAWVDRSRRINQEAGSITQKADVMVGRSRVMMVEVDRSC